MKSKAEESLHINYRVPKGASGAYVDYAKEFMKRELGKSLVEFLLQGKQGMRLNIFLRWLVGIVFLIDLILALLIYHFIRFAPEVPRWTDNLV